MDIEQYHAEGDGGSGRPERPERERELSFRIETGMSTEAGEKHKGLNEDYALVDKSRGLFAVFDGAGGYEGGYMASRFVSKRILEILDQLPKNARPQEIQQTLKDALLVVDQELVEEAKRQGKEGAGTTAVILKIIAGDENYPDQLILVSIGDTRAYLRRGHRGIHQISKDDDYFAGTEIDNLPEIQVAREEVDKIVTENDFRRCSPRGQELFRNRNAISQMIGSGRIRPEVVSLPVREGDCLALTSDGIHDNLIPGEIDQIVAEPLSPEERAQRLVEAAKQRRAEGVLRSKDDDATALVIDLISKG